MDALENLARFEIPSVVSFTTGEGGMPKMIVTARQSRAEVYLHGAHVTAFQKNSEPPLLFLSQASRFTPGKAIRGGIPICFPWFGPRSGDVAHGFARITSWEVAGTQIVPEGGATVRFRLPTSAVSSHWPRFVAELTVTVSDTLTLELEVTNQTADRVLQFENCLHTYFTVSDVRKISIHGLHSARYVDKLDTDALRVDNADALHITAQTDRTYIDTLSQVEIRDPILGRTIRVTKTGSASTVVWNPWTTQPLPDIAPDEYTRMVCVESGNVERNGIRLPPGHTSTLKVVLSSC